MDKKTIIGIVLMSLIFIGYVLFNSKQQAEYQEYLQTVQVFVNFRRLLLNTQLLKVKSSSSACTAREIGRKHT